jgi:hypothetical protein
MSRCKKLALLAVAALLATGGITAAANSAAPGTPQAHEWVCC